MLKKMQYFYLLLSMNALSTEIMKASDNGDEEPYACAESRKQREFQNEADLIRRATANTANNDRRDTKAKRTRIIAKKNEIIDNLAAIAEAKAEERNRILTDLAAIPNEKERNTKAQQLHREALRYYQAFQDKEAALERYLIDQYGLEKAMASKLRNQQ